MRAGKPLPVLYTPTSGDCEANTDRLKSDQDRTYGRSRVRLRPSLCLERSKGGTTVKLENFINYYYALKALQFLLEQGFLSETEYETVCRYNAEIFKPEKEYI